MVVLTMGANKIKDIAYYAYAVQENITVTSGDTIICADFSDAASSISESLLIQNATGVKVTTTNATNIVTVGGAVTAVECTLYIFGRRV